MKKSDYPGSLGSRIEAAFLFSPQTENSHTQTEKGGL